MAIPDNDPHLHRIRAQIKQLSDERDGFVRRKAVLEGYLRDAESRAQEIRDRLSTLKDLIERWTSSIHSLELERQHYFGLPKPVPIWRRGP